MLDAPLKLLMLVLLLGAIAGLRTVRGDEGTPVTLAAGALLLCGLYAGKVARLVQLPRLTGYLIVGVLVGPYVFGFIPAEGVGGLELVKGLAVSLIALTAGTELRLGLIRRVGKTVLKLAASVSAVVFVICTAVVVAVRSWLPFMAEMTVPQATAVAALASAVIVSFSPTVTIAVIQETRARGDFSDFLMAMVIVGDLVVMVAFALCAGVTRAVFGGGFNVASLFGGVGWELFGSLLVGAGMGLLMLLYLRKVGRELPVFISAVCFAAAEMGTALHLSPLLVSLAAGALISNGDEREGVRLNNAVERAGLPVFALFFAAAGAGLHLGALTTVGPVALLLVAVRAGAIYWSSRRFAPAGDGAVKDHLWKGLISQAGVTFGLAALVRKTFPSFGPAVEVLIIAMVTVHELIGPVLMKRALVAAGAVATDKLAEKVY